MNKFEQLLEELIKVSKSHRENEVEAIKKYLIALYNNSIEISENIELKELDCDLADGQEICVDCGYKEYICIC